MYEVSSHYDSTKKKTIIDSKTYLGIFTGYDNDGTPTFERAADRGRNKLKEGLLENIDSFVEQHQSVQKRDRKKLRSFLQFFMEDPHGVFHGLITGDMSVPESNVDIPQESDLTVERFLTISAHIPLGGASIYLSKKPDAGKVKSFENTQFLHLLTSSSARVPLAVAITDGKYAPWRNEFSKNDTAHTILFLDPLRPLDELSKNLKQNEIIGCIFPESQLEFDEEATDAGLLDTEETSNDKADNDRIDNLIEIAPDTAERRWYVRHTDGAKDVMDYSWINVDQFNRVTSLVATEALGCIQWDRMSTSELKDRLPAIGEAFFWFTQLFNFEAKPIDNQGGWVWGLFDIITNSSN